LELLLAEASKGAAGSSVAEAASAREAEGSNAAEAVAASEAAEVAFTGARSFPIEKPIRQSVP